MADPASIIGTVVGVTAAVATLIAKTTNFIERLKMAPQVVQNFLKELKDFEALLKETAHVLEERRGQEVVGSDRFSVKKIVQESKESIERVQRIIPAPAPRESDTSLKRRLQIVIKTDAFVESRMHMHATSGSLNLLLHTITVAETLKIRNSQGDIGLSQGRIETEIFILGEMMFNLDRKLDHLQKDRQGDNTQNLQNRGDVQDSGTSLETSAPVSDFKACLGIARLVHHKAQEEIRSGSIVEWDSFAKTVSLASKDVEVDDGPLDRDEGFLRAEINYLHRMVNELVAPAKSAFNEAKEAQQRCIRLQERLEEYHGQSFENRLMMLKQLAEIMFQHGEAESYSEARDILRKALDLVDDSHDLQRADILFDIAMTFLKEVQADAAGMGLLHPTPQAEKLLRQAEHNAGEALSIRKQGTVECPTAVEQSVKLLDDIFAALYDSTKQHALREIYPDYFGDNPLPTVPREGTRPETRESADKWLRNNGFTTTNRDTTINTPHKETDLTPLITAICQTSENPDSEEVDSALLAIISIADPNTPDVSSDYGFSPVMWSVKDNNARALMLLLDANVDLSFYDKRGKAAAHVAVDWDSRECLEILLQHDSDLASAIDSQGSTPLHTAINKCSRNLAELLLRHNPDVDATDIHGQTALHLAVDVSSADLTQLLLQHNPNLNIRNLANRTALEESIERNQRGRISALIQFYQARGSSSSQGPTQDSSAVSRHESLPEPSTSTPRKSSSIRRMFSRS